MIQKHCRFITAFIPIMLLAPAGASRSVAGSGQQNSLPSVSCSPSFFRLNSPVVGEEQAACLDELLLRMTQNPAMRLVLDGHRDVRERTGISLTRANLARRYMVEEKGISSSRIITRNFADTCPHYSGDVHMNGRVEMWLLDAGSGTDTIEPLKRCAPGFVPLILTTEKAAPWKGKWTAWEPL